MREKIVLGALGFAFTAAMALMSQARPATASAFVETKDVRYRTLSPGLVGGTIGIGPNETFNIVSGTGGVIDRRDVGENQLMLNGDDSVMVAIHTSQKP